MASLDFLERKLLKIIAETDPVRLKRQWVSRHAEPFPEIEQRKGSRYCCADSTSCLHPSARKCAIC